MGDLDNSTCKYYLVLRDIDIFDNVPGGNMFSDYDIPVIKNDRNRI